LNHSVIVIAFVSAQSDPIKRRTLYLRLSQLKTMNVHPL
jgi:hypothetical protein